MLTGRRIRRFGVGGRFHDVKGTLHPRAEAVKLFRQGRRPDRCAGTAPCCWDGRQSLSLRESHERGAVAGCRRTRTRADSAPTDALTERRTCCQSRRGRLHMRRVGLLGLIVAALMAAPGLAAAQTATGQITGSVQDPSGAVMRKVKVTVTNQETGLTRTTTTNDQGDYVVPLLPVG